MENSRSIFSFCVVAVAVIVFASFSDVNGQALVPSPDCTSALLNLSSCLSFVTDDNVTTADPGCCPSVAGLFESLPVCLCQLLGNSQSLGIAINRARAFTLPSICRISGADPSLCSLLGAPVGSPAAGEDAATPSGSVAGIPVSAPEYSTASPPGSSDGGWNIRFPSLVFFVGLAGATMAVF